MVKSSERRWRFGNDLDLCRMRKQRANFVPEFASNEIKPYQKQQFERR